MNRSLLGLIRYEYRMMIRRPGPWIAFLLVFAFHAASMLRAGRPGSSVLDPAAPWKSVAEWLFVMNLLAPVIAGVAASDRMVRDDKLGVRELQRGAPLPAASVWLGKYAGVLAAVLTPIFLFLALSGAWLIAGGGQPAALAPALAAAFALITVPAYAFVTAFSLACPLVLPVRVYQILFIGYWFWGNYISPEFMPTLNGTLLTASGSFALEGLFGGRVVASPARPLHGPGEAIANLAVLLGLAAAALAVGAVVRARRERES